MPPDLRAGNTFSIFYKDFLLSVSCDVTSFFPQFCKLLLQNLLMFFFLWKLPLTKRLIAFLSLLPDRTFGGVSYSCWKTLSNYVVFSLYIDITYNT